MLLGFPPGSPISSTIKKTCTLLRLDELNAYQFHYVVLYVI